MKKWRGPLVVAVAIPAFCALATLAPQVLLAAAAAYLLYRGLWAIVTDDGSSARRVW